MSSPKASAKRGPATVAALLLLLEACGPEGEWVTPSGVPLGAIDCTSPAPLDDRMRKEVCLARVIEETPEAIGRCRKDGGQVGPISPVDRRFACIYRKPDAANTTG
jgi:hypothetical protein